jgi:peptide/nickel transport system substrate-binding protein
MIIRTVIKAAAFGVLALSILGCGGKKQEQTQAQASAQQISADGVPRNKTIYIGGDQWGEPNTFNPLCDWPAWPVKGKCDLLYEPLMVFNSLSGEMEPLLAHSLQKSPDTISVILDSRAKWSDGTPLTAEDVVFTFDIGRNF